MNDKTYKHWKLETDEHGIVWCHIDVSGASTNILSAEVLDEFSDLLDNLAASPPKGLVILSDKTNGFIAGADIREFTRIESPEDAMQMLKRGQSAFDKLDALSCPTLSLINGFCLGGGMELALACDYRIVLENDRIKLGLPEVLLGIHPGFGGTMRLVRLLGPMQAIPLMLQGRTVNPRTAGKLGLVDYVVPERQFMASATKLILRRPTPKKAGKLVRLLNLNPFRKLLARFLRYQTAKKVRLEHYPAPFSLIDVWEQFGDNEKTFLKGEAESVARLASNTTSRNLVRVYFLQEKLKSIGADKDFSVDNVHVVGAGVMGGDIAAWCAMQGMRVGLQDREPKYIAPAIQRAWKLYSKKLKHPRLVQAVMDRLMPDIAARNIDKADVVIEAIIENAEAKAGLFKEIEPRLKDQAILATNTSSIALEVLNRDLQDPARLVGIHFFNPVAKMQLVEIIHAETTGQEWVDRAAAFCRQIGRLPLPVKSSPGFLVNRVLTPYLMETMVMYEEGIMPELIDKVAVDFGMPMGPIELADTVGLDICLSVARNLSEKIDIPIPDLLVQMVDKGTLGKKTGSGFYEYKQGKPRKKSVDTTGQSLTDIEDRLVLRMLNECVACLREGIVEDEDLLDAGMIFGTGFAPFRGGPMFYAKERGYLNLAVRLGVLNKKYGERFKPDPYWEELQE
ncbi:MAG: 3-hydroxyacyl-CoA dehydrogenase NAD-binding domain-containing protein [Gammaproteobacteria bacterium]